MQRSTCVLMMVDTSSGACIIEIFGDLRTYGVSGSKGNECPGLSFFGRVAAVSSVYSEAGNDNAKTSFWGRLRRLCKGLAI